MALQMNKSTSVTGQSVVDGTVVVYLSANISPENLGNSTVSQSIQNQELYAANRVACRRDIAEFQEAVYAIEDEFLAEATV